MNNFAPKNCAAYRVWLGAISVAIVTEVAAFFVVMRTQDAETAQSTALGVMIFALALLLANLIVSSHWLQQNPKTSAPKVLRRIAYALWWLSLITALACGGLGAIFIWAMAALIGGL